MPHGRGSHFSNDSFDSFPKLSCWGHSIWPPTSRRPSFPPCLFGLETSVSRGAVFSCRQMFLTISVNWQFSRCISLSYHVREICRLNAGPETCILYPAFSQCFCSCYSGTTPNFSRQKVQEVKLQSPGCRHTDPRLRHFLHTARRQGDAHVGGVVHYFGIFQSE